MMLLHDATIIRTRASEPPAASQWARCMSYVYFSFFIVLAFFAHRCICTDVMMFLGWPLYTHTCNSFFAVTVWANCTDVMMFLGILVCIFLCLFFMFHFSEIFSTIFIFINDFMWYCDAHVSICNSTSADRQYEHNCFDFSHLLIIQDAREENIAWWFIYFSSFFLLICLFLHFFLTSWFCNRYMKY